jgi:hypothetical protein
MQVPHMQVFPTSPSESKCQKMFIAVIGIKLYNRMCIRIKKLEKFKDLKINIKTFLLNYSFYSLEEYFCF